MGPLLGTPLDLKHIGLVKVLYGLRQDLDTYSLIVANAAAINRLSAGKFFGHVQQLTQERIALGLCKIYEKEKGYELNSISAVVREISKHTAQVELLDMKKLRNFVKQYEGPVTVSDHMSAMTSTVGAYRRRFKDEFQVFKTFRDKIVAHSEYGITLDHLPSYDVMDQLFNFGANFYELVSSTFVGVSPVDLKANRPVKSSLKRVFRHMGLVQIIEDIE